VYYTAGVFRHYSLEYWSSCGRDDSPPGVTTQISTWQLSHPDAKKIGSVQLLRDTWYQDTYKKTYKGSNRIRNTVNVSVINYNNDTATAFESVSVYDSSDESAADWKLVLDDSKTYGYAEQPGTTYAEHWPNSYYQLSDSGNNSNTFVREIVAEALGTAFVEMSGNHPGNWAPPQPVTNEPPTPVPHI